MQSNESIEYIPDLWMVCRVPLGGKASYSESPNPKKLYTSLKSAERDAEEMCRSSGRSFYILRVVAIVQTETTPVKWLRGV